MTEPKDMLKNIGIGLASALGEVVVKAAESAADSVLEDVEEGARKVMNKTSVTRKKIRRRRRKAGDE